MPASDTQTLIEFFSREENAPLIMDFMAEAGGDPDQYGAATNSVDELITPSGFATALKIFTHYGVEFGVITEPSVVAAASVDDVDWVAVSRAANHTLEQGLAGR